MALLVTFGARSWTVVPPPPPQVPSTAFVSDYGIHSRLALQIDEHLMVEYTYGEWDYYARRDRTVWRGFMAMAFPTEGTLGRRFLPFTDERSEFEALSGADRSARIEVDFLQAQDLLKALDDRYSDRIDTEMELPRTDLSFVRDDLSYSLFRNSNHQTAEWLRRLGCEIRGSPLLSNFRIGEAP